MRSRRDTARSRLRPDARSSSCTHLLAAVIVVAFASRADATSYSWNVASGDWFTTTNWSPNGVPGAADDAVIANGGTATLNAAASVTSFTLSNGTRDGTGTLDVSGTMT
jgi:hypothetical protein